MTKKLLMAGVLALSGAAAHAETVSCGNFSADLNPTFPGLRSYSFAGNTVALPAAAKPEVLLNGKPYTPAVTLTVTGADSAEYRLEFKELAVTMTATVAVTRQALAFTITGVKESGTFAVRTIEIPGLVLLAGTGADEVALGNFPAASYASEKPEDHDIFTTAAALEFRDNGEGAPAVEPKDGKKPEKKDKNKNRNLRGERGASYAFVGNGRLAAGLYTNVMDENLRMIVRTDGDGDARTLTVSPGMWTWREIPAEVCPPPQVRLFVAGDENGDGRATWQDAAIVYRKNTPAPYGGEKTKLYPVAHIALNFASQATYPFLRVLDNAKKVWLYTDGLGQRIQHKGFAGEGHDSSHPDYAGNVGRRQGGRDELNFVMRRGHDFNVISGVHINAHEYHKEAKSFSPAIADLSAVGWSWLDDSYLTDYRYDSAYGTLYQRLDAMREDLPWLDFAYLDVYYGRGWPGWRMHTKVNSLGIMQFTEFPGVMERGVIWNHVANDWTQQVWGKGDRSAIARFIYYSQKNTFRHDPLLRGTNCDGFMGWHGETNMLRTVKSAITVNLPTAYLQHFALIRQEPDRAWFTGGVHTETAGSIDPVTEKVDRNGPDTISDDPEPPPSAGKSGMTSRIYGRDGQLVNSCRYAGPATRPEDILVFLPWDPYTECKIYHWNEKGGDSTWTLPRSWAGVASAPLYRLTDLGRVFEREIPVVDGKVTLAGIAADTPYVLYRETPAALPDMRWGEGGLVRDPGFDSHTFSAWAKDAGTEGVAVENDAKTGQSELVVRGAAPAGVSQEITGLQPGQTYAASAWVNVEGTRDATFAVETAATPPAFIDRQAWTIVSATRSEKKNGPRKMFDGDPRTLWQTASAKPEPAFPHEVTISLGTELELAGFTQTAPAGLGEGTIKEFEAWTSPDNKKWKRAAKGEFAYDAAGRADVAFGKSIRARYFRLVAVSGIKDRPRTAVAELDMVTVPAPAAAATPTAVLASNTVNRTALPNYTDQSGKYKRNWHRLKVLFTAPDNGRALIRLLAGKGADGAIVRFDDVRVVKGGVSLPPKKAKNVVLFEDFENVDEGWGPFMYGWKGPMNTHLSEANPPYTDDTIGGRYSLKSFKESPTQDENPTGMLYRTVPATLKLKPNTAYRVTFEYLCDSAGLFALAAGVDGGKINEVASTSVIPDGSWKVKTFTVTVKTDGREGWFIGVLKTDSKKTGCLVIDNLLVEEVPAGK